MGDDDALSGSRFPLGPGLAVDRYQQMEAILTLPFRKRSLDTRIERSALKPEPDGDKRKGDPTGAWAAFAAPSIICTGRLMLGRNPLLQAALAFPDSRF